MTLQGEATVISPQNLTGLTRRAVTKPSPIAAVHIIQYVSSEAQNNVVHFPDLRTAALKKISSKRACYCYHGTSDAHVSGATINYGAREISQP